MTQEELRFCVSLPWCDNLIEVTFVCVRRERGGGLTSPQDECSWLLGYTFIGFTASWWPRPSLVYESHYSQGNPCASSTWCLYFRWLRPSRVCIALPLWGPCAAATPTPHPRSNNSSFTFGHRNLPEWTVGKLTGHLLPGNTNVSVGIKIWCKI